MIHGEIFACSTNATTEHSEYTRKHTPPTTAKTEVGLPYKCKSPVIIRAAGKKETEIDISSDTAR